MEVVDKDLRKAVFVLLVGVSGGSADVWVARRLRLGPPSPGACPPRPALPARGYLCVTHERDQFEPQLVESFRHTHER